MTPSPRPRAAPEAPPARTPAEAAERFRAAGYRVRHRAARRRAVVVDLPPLLPHLLAQHGSETPDRT